MGKRGPKRQPESLKVFKGTRYRHGESVNPDAKGSPEPPDTLGAIGQAKWRELAPQLISLGLLSALDQGHLEVYCEAWDVLGECRQILAREGFVISNDKGNLSRHPAAVERDKARQTIKQYGAEFGLTPASRAGLNPAKAAEADELDSFKVG